MTMDGRMEAGEALGGSQPLQMEMTETMTWKVVSVHEDGVATVRVTIDEMSGSMNGIEMPAETTADAPSSRCDRAGRPRPHRPAGFVPGSTRPAAPASRHGADDTAVAGRAGRPGDTWTEEFSQDIPFGEGTIEYTATNTLERYEDVNGVQAAVVTSRYTVPMDFRIEFGKLLESMGGAEGITGATGMAGASISYGGEGSFIMTSWIAREAKEMVKMTSSGSFDMTMTFEGVQGLDAAEVGFTGDFTRQEPGPRLTPTGQGSGVGGVWSMDPDSTTPSAALVT
jgi:hypothetical protein